MSQLLVEIQCNDTTKEYIFIKEELIAKEVTQIRGTGTHNRQDEIEVIIASKGIGLNVNAHTIQSIRIEDLGTGQEVDHTFAELEPHERAVSLIRTFAEILRQ
ncbi:MAG: hypothetical protein GY861_05755 [bacterium]|nr:hypothetical protein [bacterium]